MSESITGTVSGSTSPLLTFSAGVLDPDDGLAVNTAASSIQRWAYRAPAGLVLGMP